MSLPNHSSLTDNLGECALKRRRVNWCVWMTDGPQDSCRLPEGSMHPEGLSTPCTHTQRALQCLCGSHISRDQEWIQKDPIPAPNSLLVQRCLSACRRSDLENQIRDWSQRGGTSGAGHKSGRLSPKGAAELSMLWGVISHICILKMFFFMWSWWPRFVVARAHERRLKATWKSVYIQHKNRGCTEFYPVYVWLNRCTRCTFSFGGFHLHENFQKPKNLFINSGNLSLWDTATASIGQNVLISTSVKR